MRLILVPVLLAAGWCGGGTPQPTPEPPTPPSPQCVEGQNCACWHFPGDSRTWLYACCVPSVPGGVVNVVGGPAQCPPEPTPAPTPSPTPTLAPTPTPTPGVTSCPKQLAPGAYSYLNNKPYGQGFDATVRVYGDPAFCLAIHGVNTNDCHLEGWPQRSACEMELLDGCPIWQFSQDQGKTPQPCVDNQGAQSSCDHFGSVEYRDDPKTPTTGTTFETLKGFEGTPKECGLQRDSHGPRAGFFVIAHGAAVLRACKPDGTGCGPWLAFEH